MEGPFRILLVEDDPADARQIEEALAEVADPAFRLERVDLLSAALRRLDAESFDAILLDLWLADSQGLATLAAVSTVAGNTPVLVLAGQEQELVALKAVQAGAHDYLVKGQVFGTMLGRAVSFAIERERSARQLAESDAQFRRLFETMGQGVVFIDGDGRFVDANPAAEAILGMSVAELRGGTSADPLWDGVREDGSPMPPDERPSAVALRTGEEVDGVIMGIRNRADGGRRWILLHARPQVRPGESLPYQAFTTFTDITSLREAEAARKESEERLRLIAETLNDVFYLNEVRPFRMLYVSPAFERVWGRPQEGIFDEGLTLEETSRRFLEAVHPEDRPYVREAVAGRVAGREVHAEYRIERPGGEVRWIADRSYPLFDARGGQRTVGTAEDITPRKLAEEQLRRSEEQLSRILETATEAITIIDRDGSITFANRAAEEVLGLARAEVTSRAYNDPAWRITAVDGGPFPDAELPAARVLATGAAVFGVEHAIETDTGRRVVLSVNAAPLRDAGGEVEGVVASIRDVTAARAAADQLRFQAGLLDAVGEAVAAADALGTVTYWNGQAERLYGWSAEEAIGRSVLDLISTPSTRSPVADALAGVIGGASWSGELLLARRGGGTFPAFVTAAPIRDEAGEVIGIVGASTDLTEVKRLEHQLHQAQRMEAVGRLAGGVAHDFNNILTSIQGYSEFAMAGLDADDPLRADIAEIRAAADRAAALTRQLLAFSRKQVLQPRVLDLAEVVGGMEKMLGRLIGEDVELVFSVDPDLGQVKADPGQIEQVVLNLAVNARDAMPRGGRLSIELANEEGGGAPRVLLRVRDTGTGIPPEVLPHIFEPFFTTKEKGQGTGLGLATVYGIVTQSEGDVVVGSEPGTGTLFTVRLPRVDEPAEAPARAAMRTAAGGGETVLLVEDEDAVRALAVRTLRNLGYRVFHARGGEEALRIAERLPGTIHLLLTDVVMPEMSGSDLAGRLAAARPDLRVLYISGYTDERIARHGVLEEGQVLLEKPFSPALLGERVREVLDSTGGEGRERGESEDGR